MSGSNMICPKCKTFQPAAEHCRSCGVIVAKLWAKERAEHTSQTATSPANAEPEGARLSRFRPMVWLAGVAAVLIAVVWVGWNVVRHAWDGGAFGHYQTFVEQALDAQQAAEMTRERVEQAMYDAEMGYRPGSDTTGNGSAVAGISAAAVARDLAALVEQLNAEVRAGSVTLRPSDIRPTYARCAREVERYFPALRPSAADEYPLAQREILPVRDQDLPGRYRCEGSAGTTYLSAPPRQTEGLERCWRRHRGKHTRGASRSSRSARIERWIELRWDDERLRWSIYTAAEKRDVDRHRLRAAHMSLNSDVERRYARREGYARSQITTLSAEIEALDSKLRGINDDVLRLEAEAERSRHVGRLRKALVQQGQVLVCKKAGVAALAAKEASLSGG